MEDRLQRTEKHHRRKGVPNPDPKTHVAGGVAAKMQTMGVNIDQQMISRIENNLRIVTDYELICFCKVLQIEEIELPEELTREK